MDRKADIAEYLNEYRQQRKKAKQRCLDENIDRLIPLFLQKLNDLIADQLQRRREGTAEKIKFIFLCRLLSSGYTESYESVLGMSSDMLYLDEKKSLVFWNPAPLYTNIDKDTEEAEKLLRRDFTLLDSFELFYVKQLLLDDDWGLLKNQFPGLAGRTVGLLIDSMLDLEDEISFLCGNYMDNMEIVWQAERSRK